MSTWFVRWPNGGLSMVKAATLARAYDLVDEVDDPGCAEWLKLNHDCVVHLTLEDDGNLTVDTRFDDMLHEDCNVMDWAYPIAANARENQEEYSLSREQTKDIVPLERERQLKLAYKQGKCFSEVVGYGQAGKTK